MGRWTRRTFLKSATVAGASTLLAGGRSAAAEKAAVKKPRERANILYAVSTGCWGPVTPPGQPLPLLQILDETAAAGFNGVRLTGFPSLLEQNGLTVDQYGEELASRGLRFSTVSFGGNYYDSQMHADIRQRARAALAAYKKYGATAMVFFPPSPVPATEEAEAFNAMFRFVDELGKMAVEEYGVRMGLHNHTDTIVENQRQVDRFLEGTDPRYVFAAWDSAHLLVGGCDVQATYKKSIERLVYTDFKDATLQPTAEDYLAPNGTLRRRLAPGAILQRDAGARPRRNRFRGADAIARRPQVSRLDQPRSGYDPRVDRRELARVDGVHRGEAGSGVHVTLAWPLRVRDRF